MPPVAPTPAARRGAGRPPKVTPAPTPELEDDDSDDNAPSVKAAAARPISPNAKVRTTPGVAAPSLKKPAAPALPSVDDDDDDDDDSPPDPTPAPKSAKAPSVGGGSDSSQVAQLSSRITGHLDTTTKTLEVLAENVKDLMAEVKTLEVSLREEQASNKDFQAKVLAFLGGKSKTKASTSEAISYEEACEAEEEGNPQDSRSYQEDRVPADEAAMVKICNKHQINQQLLEWIFEFAKNRYAKYSRQNNRVSVQLVAESASTALGKSGTTLDVKAIEGLIKSLGMSSTDGMLLDPPSEE